MLAHCRSIKDARSACDQLEQYQAKCKDGGGPPDAHLLWSYHARLLHHAASELQAMYLASLHIGKAHGKYTRKTWETMLRDRKELIEEALRNAQGAVERQPLSLASQVRPPRTLAGGSVLPSSMRSWEAAGR